MQLYNTLTQKKEHFKPLSDNHVGMYLCGPTVYDLAHLGHGRSAVSFDVIRKYFLYKGYKVTFVTNYTDIDDKMINRANENNISVPQLADKIIPEYQQDYQALGITSGDVQPKATETIPEMIEIIKGLEAKGHTYQISDGVYFDVSTFADYGKLSKQNLEELRSGARVSVNEEKRHPQDFVLWKFSKPGEPSWDSPWGSGRPGWHIECSAMSWKYLGETFDIHAGGADLIFPHHECEIAQSESFHGKTFARYWLHNGFIRVDNEKMSKSLGNFFTLRDIFTKYKPQVVRYLFLQTHYRSPIDFNHELLDHATNSLMRIHDSMRRLESSNAVSDSALDQNLLKQQEDLLTQTKTRFEEAMDDDFETPRALAACFDLIKALNKYIDDQGLAVSTRQKAQQLFTDFDKVLGIFTPSQTEEISEELLALIQAREDARKQRDWQKSDQIRSQLLEQGIQLEDTAQGTVWKKI